jgi:hypothetical protein
MENLIEELKEEEASSRQESLNKRVGLEKQFKGGTGWFFWIAGLSLIHIVSAIAGNGWNVFFEFGLTFFIERRVLTIARIEPLAAMRFIPVIDFLLVLSMAGLFVFFGILARKGHQRAIIVGILVYGFDGFLLFISFGFASFLFHIIAFFGLVRGLLAYRELDSIGGKEIFMASDHAAAAKQKKDWPSWIIFVIPGVLLLLPFLILLITNDFTSAVVMLLILSVLSFVVAAVLNWRRLKTLQRWGFPLLIGWQLVMLAFFVYLELPDSFIGDIGKEKTAEAFMNALSTGNIQEVMHWLGVEETYSVAYNVIAGKFSNPEIFPVSWELELSDRYDRLDGTAVFPNGQTLDVRLFLEWRQSELRWFIRRVEFGDKFEYDPFNFPANIRAAFLTSSPLYGLIDLRTALETIAMLCLVATAVFIVLNPSLFIETFWRRYKDSWYKGVS